MKVVLINGLEKHHREFDDVFIYLINCAKKHNIDIQVLNLKEERISHCTECRICTQKKGFDPVKCFLKDGMDQVIDEIESADSYIIITDRSSIFKRNKLFKKFSERLLGYYYWPKGQEIAKPRKVNLNKNAIVLNYNLATHFRDYCFELAKKHLKKSAKSIGADVIDSFMITPKKRKENLLQDYEVQLEALFKKLLPAA